MLKEWKESVQERNHVNKGVAKNTNSSDSGTWAMICENIGTKASDYLGDQDITRMRESIIAKANIQA